LIGFVIIDGEFHQKYERLKTNKRNFSFNRKSRFPNPKKLLEKRENPLKKNVLNK
jgi:hypothetical protein